MASQSQVFVHRIRNEEESDHPMSTITALLEYLDERAKQDERMGLPDVAAIYRAQHSALLEIARRDWDTRVLDAWAELHEEAQPPTPVNHRYMPGLARWSLSGSCVPGVSLGRFPDARAARHAAALAIWPTLPESVRADLGECPGKGGDR